MSDNEKKELVRQFGLYLEKFDCLKPKSRGNYLSWTRHLMKYHNLWDIRTKEDVDAILQKHKIMMASPLMKVYKKKDDYRNFHATLYRFLPFITIWRAEREASQIAMSYNDLIAMIAKQACSEHALTFYNAIVFKAFREDYVISSQQKNEMDKALAKFDCKISADKLFMPGSNCYPAK